MRKIQLSKIILKKKMKYFCRLNFYNTTYSYEARQIIEKKRIQLLDGLRNYLLTFNYFTQYNSLLIII